jgi:YfiH family protein
VAVDRSARRRASTGQRGGNGPSTDPRRSNGPSTDPRRSNGPSTDPRRSNGPSTDPRRSNEPSTDPRRSNEPSTDPRRSNGPSTDRCGGGETGRMPTPESTPTAPTVPVTTWAVFDGHPLDAVITTRAGGESTGPYASLNLGLHVGDDPALVVENRRRAAAAIGLGLEDVVLCRQVHGREVVVVGDADRGRGALGPDDAPAADAVVTATPGLGIGVMVADCVPLVLYDPTAHVLAAVHAGWRGTVARVTDAALDAMAGLGADPADVLVGIGPAITAARYQVGEDVVDAARDCFADEVGIDDGGPDSVRPDGSSPDASSPDVGGHDCVGPDGVGPESCGPDGAPSDRGSPDVIVRPDGSGRWTFDLWAANRRLLVEAGVRPGNIEVSAVGTGPGTPFFSDRAARPCGRFAALARLQPRG